MVIVGAGHSGGKAAAALRKYGWEGPITVIGNEPHPPYDRPPLSKAVLLGKKTTKECSFFSPTWYEQNHVELLLDSFIVELDRSTKQVKLVNGQTVPYERLLLATGATPNPLMVQGAHLSGVHCLRTVSDSENVARYLRKDQRIVVVGAGFIGLEVAAAAIELGASVTVLEAAPRALARSLPIEVSSTLVQVHLERGVDFRFGVSVNSIEGRTHVTGVCLTDETFLEADCLVYGIGVKPNAQLAQSAGLETGNGIIVDQYLRTSDPDIFSCGDVCSFFSNLYQIPLRLESWKNADDQATIAARNMLDHQVAYDEVPWFWSNQYDIALQVAGLPVLGETIATRTTDAAKLYFSLDRRGMLLGISGLGPARAIAADMRTAKSWLPARPILNPLALSDVNIPLAQLYNASA
jgi:3-phenylpropionate/trans-cinnamate dioxygenase ferredoxin reductase component